MTARRESNNGSRVALLDDRCLRSVLMNDMSAELRIALRSRELATTGAWLYRLCQATANATVTGSLSGPIASLEPKFRQRVLDQLVRLPPSIRIADLRQLAWPMATLVQRHRLNFLNLEAVSAAQYLGAELVLGSQQSQLLLDACEIERIRVRIVSRGPGLRPMHSGRMRADRSEER